MLDNHRNADGTYDGVGVMSEVSGLSRAGVTELLAEVRANAALLDACGRHDFLQIAPRFGSKWKCVACGGVVSAEAVHWYVRGQAHGRA